MNLSVIVPVLNEARTLPALLEYLLPLRRSGVEVLLVDGDSEGNSYVAQHAAEVNAPLVEIYKELPELILKRFGEVTDPTQELIN